MKYTGYWINKITNEEINFTLYVGTDNYLLQWKRIDGEFKKEQKVQISITNNQLSHLPFSERFGETIIHNIDSNTIIVGGEKFVRKKE